MGLPRLLVVGHGMVAQRLVERLVALDALTRYRITILGEEPLPAYDRVHLARVLNGEPSADLVLRDRTWFADRGITLRLTTRVAVIDRVAREVETADGERLGWDRLVLATGSAVRVPPLAGLADPRVIPFRSVDDAERLLLAVRAAAHDRAPRVAVLGGGLLGIELAQILGDRGAKVEILEAASHLLSQQLDVPAAARLREQLQKRGIAVHLGARARALDAGPDGVRIPLALNAANATPSPVRADVVLLATGVRPRDELATAAKLACDPRGGVKVDRTLRTSDPHIYAVGECVWHRGTRYGLVAPGFEMAEVAAQRLMGRAATFRDSPRIAKLKLDRYPVACAGDGLVDSGGVRALVKEGPGYYRRLVLRRGRLIGAVIAGEWRDADRVFEAVVGRERFRTRHIERFRSGRDVFPEARTRGLDVLPDHAPLCTCTGTTCGALRAAVQDGCRTVEALSERTGAGSVCGTCRPRLGVLLGMPSARMETDRPLLAATFLALALVLVTLLATPIALAGSVQESNVFDGLWRDGAAKQLTGFLLAGLCALSLVLSLRKRVPRIRMGRYRTWRVVHATLGIGTLVAAGVHTGFRLGANLDRVLMVTFLALALLGGVAAGLTALEGRLPPAAASTCRRTSTKAHVLLFWPFPLLVIFHALKAFYF